MVRGHDANRPYANEGGRDRISLCGAAMKTRYVKARPHDHQSETTLGRSTRGVRWVDIRHSRKVGKTVCKVAWPLRVPSRSLGENQVIQPKRRQEK